MIELVVLESPVFAITKHEMRRVRFTETGGALVGYSRGHHLVVTSASGPGPRSELRIYSVLIDGKHAERFCAKVRAKTGGRQDYVGDWHCHVGFSLRPSKLDYDAMKTMATFEFSPTENPISIIWSKWSNRVRGYYYDGSGSLREVPILRPA